MFLPIYCYSSYPYLNQMIFNTYRADEMTCVACG